MTAASTSTRDTPAIAPDPSIVGTALAPPPPPLRICLAVSSFGPPRSMPCFNSFRIFFPSFSGYSFRSSTMAGGTALRSAVRLEGEAGEARIPITRTRTVVVVVITRLRPPFDPTNGSTSKWRNGNEWRQRCPEAILEPLCLVCRPCRLTTKVRTIPTTCTTFPKKTNTTTITTNAPSTTIEIDTSNHPPSPSWTCIATGPRIVVRPSDESNVALTTITAPPPFRPTNSRRYWKIPFPYFT
mmetsp:Transcript_7238/g.14855  ORF Transcript_7238/g.14855 Transcript_7238/m.14855 type:complete len:241 (+) Transcript_7238:367-1089(+)